MSTQRRLRRRRRAPFARSHEARGDLSAVGPQGSRSECPTALHGYSRVLTGTLLARGVAAAAAGYARVRTGTHGYARVLYCPAG